MPERNLVGWIEAELLNLPRTEFRSRLKAELEGKAREMMAIRESKGVRKGFRTVTPYLQVHRGAELVDFIQAAFDGVVTFRQDRPDGQLGHSEMRVGDAMLMIGDSGTEFPAMPTCLHLYVPDADETYRRAIAAGAQSIYAPMDQPYGDREAGVTDVSGNSWFISTHKAGGSHVPAGLGSVTPYLILDGVPKFIAFVTQLTGVPTLEQHESDGAVRHAKLQVGDSVIETGEAQAAFPAKPAALHLYVDDADAWFARALDAGASVLYPVEDKPYGDRLGGVTDPNSNIWYFSTNLREIG